jgi:SAM-dependent methyltransferase
MEIQLTSKDKERIDKGIRGKYTKVAVSPEGLFKYPTGRAGLEALNYDPEIIQAMPEAAATSYCGVGNPFTLEAIHEGETALDIGCGCGFDTMTAAMMAGPTGRSVGIDITREILERARKNLRETTLKNVTFQQASAEDLPFPDNSFDVVISNGVFNLIPDKAKAITEVFRVLKPGNRLMMADQILVGELPKNTKISAESWAQ